MSDKSDHAAIVRNHQLFSYPPETTYATLLTALWRRACAAAWERADARTHLVDMLHPWAHRRIEERPRYQSFVSGDGFPAELSVSWRKGVTEVRILFEPVGDDPTTRSVQDAGRAMIRALATRAGVSIRGYETVEDLFTSDDPPAHRSGVWLSLACGPDDPPHFKVYLNPYANGPDREWDTVGHAMDRLGLTPAWAPVAARRHEIEATGTGLDYLALDLTAGARARVKVYFRHRAAGLDGIHTVGAFARGYDAERAAHAAADLYRGPIGNEPMTGLAFRAGEDRPGEANIYFRMSGNTRSDAEARTRITALMDREGAPSEVYHRIADAIAPAPMETTTGVHELVAYRTRDAGPADIGVYYRLPVHAATPDDVPRPGHGWPRVPL